MAAALSSILNNPQTMQQIMGLASQLGLGGGPTSSGDMAAGDASPSSVSSSDVHPSSHSSQETDGYSQDSVPASGSSTAGTPFAQTGYSQTGRIPPGSYASAAPTAPNAGNLLGNIDLGTIAKISQILGTINTRDQNVELLLALKPHFGEKRQKKVDDAIRIMQLVKVLPLLKESGIFGNLFGGDDG